MSAPRDLGRRLADALESGDAVRLEALRRFAEAAGFDLQFDAQGQVVLHTGLYTDARGDVSRIQAPCVNPRREGPGGEGD